MRKKLITIVVQKGKVITIQNIYAKIIRREEIEIEKTRKTLKWAEMTELKKKNEKIATHKSL